jgi:hypothetical protein
MMAKKPTAKPEVIAPVKPKANPAYNPLSGMTPTSATTPVGKPTYSSDYAASSKAAADAVKAAAQQKATEAESVTASATKAAAKQKAIEAESIATANTTPTNAASSVEEKATAEKAATTGTSIEDTIKKYTAEVLNKMSQEEKTTERLSAYNILKMEFDQYGLGSLVTDIKDLLINDTPTSEFGLRLRGTDAYKARFKANEARIAAGLSALSPSEYVALEDQYQNVMRNYGLPASYYTKDSTGKQAGFEKFIAGDVSAVELEDRISTAQKRVINSNPEVTTALKQFYPDITNGDILAYTLDPTKGLEDIKRKVTAAEIGGAALQSGLETNLARAVQLGKYGVDKAAATQGYSTIGAGLQRGSQLAAIYKETPYVQATAEEEIFNMTGATKAREKRQKITGLEKAAFSGQTGLTSGALARDRAGGY